jgi:hypothetical protein
MTKKLSYKKECPRKFGGKRYYGQGPYYTGGSNPTEVLKLYRDRGLLARIVWGKAWTSAGQKNQIYWVYVRPKGR